jgi:hypothetical protein
MVAVFLGLDSDDSCKIDKANFVEVLQKALPAVAAQEEAKKPDPAKPGPAKPGPANVQDKDKGKGKEDKPKENKGK